MAEPRIYTVTFTRSKKKVQVEEWLTLQLAARRAKLTIPTDCCHGVCGSCEVMTQPWGVVRACITLVTEDVTVDF